MTTGQLDVQCCRTSRASLWALALGMLLASSYSNAVAVVAAADGGSGDAFVAHACLAALQHLSAFSQAVDCGGLSSLLSVALSGSLPTFATDERAEESHSLTSFLRPRRKTVVTTSCGPSLPSTTHPDVIGMEEKGPLFFYCLHFSSAAAYSRFVSSLLHLVSSGLSGSQPFASAFDASYDKCSKASLDQECLERAKRGGVPGATTLPPQALLLLRLSCGEAEAGFLGPDWPPAAEEAVEVWSQIRGPFLDRQATTSSSSVSRHQLLQITDTTNFKYFPWCRCLDTPDSVPVRLRPGGLTPVPGGSGRTFLKSFFILVPLPPGHKRNNCTDIAVNKVEFNALLNAPKCLTGQAITGIGLDLRRTVQFETVHARNRTKLKVTRLDFTQAQIAAAGPKGIPLFLELKPGCTILSIFSQPRLQYAIFNPGKNCCPTNQLPILPPSPSRRPYPPSPPPRPPPPTPDDAPPDGPGSDPGNDYPPPAGIANPSPPPPHFPLPPPSSSPPPFPSPLPPTFNSLTLSPTSYPTSYP